MLCLELPIIATWVACPASGVYPVGLQRECQRGDWAQGRKMKTGRPKGSGASGRL